MIVYILTTTFLSFIGWILYILLVRNRFSLSQQKGFVLAILCLSFIFPAFLNSEHTPTLQPNPIVRPLAFGQAIDHSSLKTFCKCEQPDYTHRIKYRTNAYINFILEHKHWVNVLIGSGIALVILLFLGQMAYLRYLIKQAQQEKLNFHGKEIIILRLQKKMGVGAFWLGKNYIIWQEDLADLSMAEQHAILKHELSHLEQKDTWLKVGLRLIQCFWLINPAFYFFKRELDLLSECIADKQASKFMPSSKDYARLLIKVKEWQLAPATMPFKGSILQTRIKRVISHTPTHSLFQFLLVAGLLVACQAVAASPLSYQLSSFFYTVETYEEIYHKADTETTEGVYCQDCETVCTPFE